MSTNPDQPFDNSIDENEPVNKTNSGEMEGKAPADDPLTTQVAALEQEIASLKDQWMRSLAEVENIRRRSQREREDASKYASTNFSRDMLSIADNLRRALECCPDQEGLPAAAISLIQGIELTENALMTTFERYNIKKVSPLRERFDPNFHQAMVEIEDGSVPAGTIVQVLQTGYVLHDRLLRPAMVGVSRQPAEVVKENQPSAVSEEDSHSH